MTAVPLLLVLALSPWNVHGDSTCPTPEAVRARISVGSSLGSGYRAYVSSTARAVHVELLDEAGGLAAERSLARDGGCDAMAEAVAVVLSAWDATIASGVSLSLATPPPSPATPPRPPAPAAAGTTAVAATPTEPRDLPPLRFDAGLGLLAARAGSDDSVGALLYGTFFPFHGPLAPLGLHAAAAVAAAHSVTIDTPPSSARFARAAFSLGLDLRVPLSIAYLDAHASGVLAALQVSGSGVDRPASDISAQLGVAGGLRALFAWNNAAAWLAFDAYVYPGQDRLVIGRVGEVGRLPRLETQLSLGISLGQFR